MECPRCEINEAATGKVTIIGIDGEEIVLMENMCYDCTLFVKHFEQETGPFDSSPFHTPSCKDDLREYNRHIVGSS